VGHPLTERLDELRPKDLEKRLRLANPPLGLVLPGSRTGEIRRMATVFGSAVARVAEQFGAMEVVVPAVPRLADTVQAAVASWRVPARVITDTGKHEAFRTARAALTKSGTSTLELALAGVPMVAAYRVPLIEELAARLLLNVSSVILVNLALGENVVPEFLQRECTPERLAKALLPLLSDTPERRQQVDAFARLDAIMEVGKGSPSDQGAVRSILWTITAAKRVAGFGMYQATCWMIPDHVCHCRKPIPADLSPRSLLSMACHRIFHQCGTRTHCGYQ
jgi:lipid-A-disaccharide synthase